MVNHREHHHPFELDTLKEHIEERTVVVWVVELLQEDNLGA